MLKLSRNGILPIFGMLLLLASCGEKSNPQMELKDDILAMKKAAEAGDFDKLYDYMNPADTSAKGMSKNAFIDLMKSPDNGAEAIKAMVGLFNNALNANPTFNSAFTEASFDLGNEKPVRFVKIEKHWRACN